MIILLLLIIVLSIMTTPTLRRSFSVLTVLLIFSLIKWRSFILIGILLVLLLLIYILIIIHLRRIDGSEWFLTANLLLFLRLICHLRRTSSIGIVIVVYVKGIHSSMLTILTSCCSGMRISSAIWWRRRSTSDVQLIVVIL